MIFLFLWHNFIVYLNLFADLMTMLCSDGAFCETVLSFKLAVEESLNLNLKEYQNDSHLMFISPSKVKDKQYS